MSSKFAPRRTAIACKCPHPAPPHQSDGTPHGRRGLPNNAPGPKTAASGQNAEGMVRLRDIAAGLRRSIAERIADEGPKAGAEVGVGITQFPLGYHERLKPRQVSRLLWRIRLWVGGRLLNRTCHLPRVCELRPRSKMTIDMPQGSTCRRPCTGSSQVPKATLHIGDTSASKASRRAVPSAVTRESSKTRTARSRRSASASS